MVGTERARPEPGLSSGRSEDARKGRSLGAEMGSQLSSVASHPLSLGFSIWKMGPVRIAQNDADGAPR